MVAAVVASDAFAVTAVVTAGVTAGAGSDPGRFFSSALSCSISACMAASCLASAGDIVGSGVAAAAPAVGVLGVPPSFTAPLGCDSCSTAAVVWASQGRAGANV